MTARERLAARDRILDALRRADEGGYSGAWYFYVDRRDVEAVCQSEPRTGRIVHGDDVDPSPCRSTDCGCRGTLADDASLDTPEATCCGDPGDCDGCRS